MTKDLQKKHIFKKRSNDFLKILKIIVLSCFCILIIFMSRISIFKAVCGENLIEFQKTRNIVDQVLYSDRGNIYDINGALIANTIASYSLYAILDENYSSQQNPGEKKLHVTEPERAAKEIGSIIGVSPDYILEILKKDKFQVEFAPYGNSLTQHQKDQIESLNLEGIYFKAHEARNYVQGPFASYMVGYATYNPEIQHLEGKMGIESIANDRWLKGKDGFHKYQVNMHGQRLKDSPEVLVPEEKGNNIYLTLDSFIQHQVETKLRELMLKHQPKWAVIAVADPKTGAILAVGQLPNFDPNTRDITDYNNYFTQVEYEVGSIMKPITFASAIETGKYNEDKLISTGSVDIDGWRISDWNGCGWGDIKVKQGLFYSSNTVIHDLVSTAITAEEQKEFLRKFGFGKPTGVEVLKEESGLINLDTLLNRVTTGYGQGSTCTASQMLQAYCALANNGSMKRLHVIDRIEDSNGILHYKHEPQEISHPISENTSKYVLNLLSESVNHENAFSSRFKIKSGLLAGKTGTANVVDQDKGGYLDSSDNRNYVYSFAGAAPVSDPKFAFIVSISQPQINPDLATLTATEDILNNINIYLKDKNNSDNILEQEYNSYLPSFINMKVDDIEKILSKYNINNHDCVIIGDGDTIIKQNFQPYTNRTNKILLLKTNYNKVYLPNFTNWSRKDIEEYSLLANLKVNFDGIGYCYSQSLPSESEVDPNTEINIKLKL